MTLNNSQDLLFPENPSLHPTSPALPGLPFFRGKVAGRASGQGGGGRGHTMTEGRWRCQTKGMNTLIKWPRKTGGEDGSEGEGGGKR